MEPALYLIPVLLGDTPFDKVIPAYNLSVIQGIKYFIVENIRSARRFLKRADPDIQIDELDFKVLDKHTSLSTISDYLNPIEEGHSIGVISEAGCPAIADPGADIVALAHKKDIKVVPLVGPSSILLALMASGFNGQNFSFNGYLPVEADKRIKKIKSLEQKIYTENCTQIFIETPYRNRKLFDDILLNCHDGTKLCIALDVTCEDERIKTKNIKEWKRQSPVLEKKPCLFLLYK